ncbi:hypothetical protein, partial [Prevotella melaninogenica]|uniref:hypothetical protein n=1 Tax=Prevotella melaninogenica TaxID=28132 RepID=UPI00241CB2FF
AISLFIAIHIANLEIWVKCVNAFCIVLTEGPKLLIKQKYGSSEIWGDKLKVLNNRHTESRRGRR